MGRQDGCTRRDNTLHECRCLNIYIYISLSLSLYIYLACSSASSLSAFLTLVSMLQDTHLLHLVTEGSAQQKTQTEAEDTPINDAVVVRAVFGPIPGKQVDPVCTRSLSPLCSSV